VKRKRSPVDLITLLVVCVLGILLGRVQTVRRLDGRSDFFSAGVRTIESPVTVPAGNLSSSIAYFSRGVFSARRLAAEHDALAALAHSADMYQEQIDSLHREIDGLRVLQQLPPILGKTRISADVIGYAPYENRITLNVGERQGVVAGAPVETPAGLAGTVQTVEGNRCQALLVTSASLTLGAIDISRNPAPAGLLHGENSSILSLTFQDPKAPVEIGDKITTSGFSDHIPRGIAIGKVISVTTDEEFGLRRATIDPAISVGELREVQVIR
jgi:rod shape-determining protein MreC